jgi:hypothetical protein
MIDVKIRYNTMCDDNHMYWRILISGVEHTCSNVIIEVPTYTTIDSVADSTRNTLVTKHHISCKASEIIWRGDVVIVK